MYLALQKITATRLAVEKAQKKQAKKPIIFPKAILQKYNFKKIM